MKSVVALRRFGRALGVNKVIASFAAKGYESRYDDSLSDAIREGDVVWDVGANVGYYTKRFVARVGASGTVVAFEPSQVNFAHLKIACEGMVQVKFAPFGLGDKVGSVGFCQGSDDLGATSRVVEDGEIGNRVEIRVGDEEVDLGLPQPNVLKIDVEGYEGEVLEGLSRCMASPKLRAVGVEVHFGILDSRAMPNVPSQIESQLRKAGFRVFWPDSSHLLALR